MRSKVLYTHPGESKEQALKRAKLMYNISDKEIASGEAKITVIDQNDTVKYWGESKLAREIREARKNKS